MAKRDDLTVRVQDQTFSLATPAGLKETLDRRQLPAITRWNRLEGRPRSVDFEAAMRAEVHDPLWNLSKQWQVGEFQGEDAGSPAGARILIEQARFRQFAADQHVMQALDDGEPLEMRIERQPVGWSFGDRIQSLDLRLLLGRRWRKLLIRVGLQAQLPAYLAAYPLTAPDPADPDHADIVAHGNVWQRFDAVAGRMIDGGTLFLFLDAAPAHRASAGIAGLSAADTATLDGLGNIFVAWVKGLLTVPTDDQDGWRPERLEYAARVTTDAPGGTQQRDDELLVAEEISDGRVDWYHFDRQPRHQRPAPQPPSAPPVAFLPTPLEFGGMPNPRWWQFEEGAVNFGAIDPGSSDIGKLLFLEHVLLYANNWYIFPYRVAAGSNALVRGLAIRNVFGERFWITAAGARDSDSWQGWGMFANNSVGDPTDTSDRHITMLPVAAKIQDAESAEAQMLIRDEMANQVWGIEKRVRAPSGQYLAGAELGSEMRRYHEARIGAPGGSPVPTEAALRYQLMTRVPENWIPFVAVHKDGDNRQTKLQRAAMPRLIDGDHSVPARIRPRTALLRQGLAETPRQQLFIETEEVPRAGIQLIDGFRRTRWYGGTTFVWRGIRKYTGRGEGSSGLAFDQLFPKPVETSEAAAPGPASSNTLVEVTAGPPPTVALTAHPDPGGGWNLEVVTASFSFAPEHDGQPHVAAEGHAQLLVNGVLTARLYGGWFHLPPLQPGSHRLGVALVANDRRVLAHKRTPIVAEATIEQTSAALPQSDGGDAEIVTGSNPPALTLAVAPAAVDGFLVTVHRENLALAPLSAGAAHVPGEGHLQLSVDGVKMARVYGDSFYLPTLAGGAHQVTVAAFTNDHRPYATGNGPVIAMVAVTSEAGRPLTLAAPPLDPHADHPHA